MNVSLRRLERGNAIVPVAVGLGLLAAGYTGYAVYAGNRVADGTTVAGVPVGGLTAEAANVKIREAASARLAKPVTLTVGDTPVTLVPSEVGLGVDVDATTNGLTGFTIDPVELYHAVTGDGADREFSATIDEGKLTEALTATATKVAIKPKEGAIAFSKGKVVVNQPVTGRTLDVPKTLDAVSKAWPTAVTVPAAVTEVAPKVPASEYARIKKEFADKVVAGPVVVKAGDTAFEVPVTSLTPAVTFAVQGAAVTPKIDTKKVVAAVHEVASSRGIEKESVSATVDYSGGTPVVSQSRTGTALNDATIAKNVVAAMTSTTKTAAVALTTTQPKLTTAAAKATLPKGMISTFTTHFPVNPTRTQNLRVAANTLNNTYVAPGETFSLNGVLGQRTAAKGYAQAQVIYAGRLTYDYGGGISQVSTTLFNAAFFAGMDFTAYTPHSFYISRYPEGREATISWPDVDQSWVNTTGAGVLIKSWVSGQDITVQMFGTKKWDVEASKGPRRNIVEPKTINDDSATCVPQPPGEGFDVTVTRIFKQRGAVVKTENFNTHYIPEDNVVCKTPYTP